MHRSFASLILICATPLISPVAVSAVTINTVPVGNAGNGNDSTGFGGVAYDYRIGTTEVTNAQYTAFLNAKGASDDPLYLYNPNMGSSFASGGITRSGSDGSFTYATIAGRDQMPVNYVNWYDAIRFANWLNNGGLASSDTETGAYTLLHDGSPTPMAIPSNANIITRNPGATWFLPSENEWYKAAFHKNNGVTNKYFAYSTSSDVFPTAQAPPGGSNSANFNFIVGDLTNVGAFANTKSPYGVFDMAGNVFEWNESLISDTYRGARGSSFTNGLQGLFLYGLRSSEREFQGPTVASEDSGFRMATVPEPSTGVLAVVACGLMWWWRKRLSSPLSFSSGRFLRRLRRTASAVGERVVRMDLAVTEMARPFSAGRGVRNHRLQHAGPILGEAFSWQRR